MAKQSFKVTSNFSFGKLKDKFQEVMQSNNTEIIKDFTKATIDKIEKGRLPELTDRTKEARSLGLSSFTGHNSRNRPNSENKPLDYTGNLKKSIKAKKEGIEMKSYGLNHHLGGWTTPAKNIGFGSKKTVKARPFIVGTESSPADEKEIKKIELETVKLLNKVMKK